MLVKVSRFREVYIAEDVCQELREEVSKGELLAALLTLKNYLTPAKVCQQALKGLSGYMEMKETQL